MKKIIPILIFIFALQSGYPYSWQNFGPEGISATNLYFYNYFGEEEIPLIIMSDSGFYLRDDNASETWLHFNYPMKDAVLLNPATLLFIAGDGSYSDGIYTFHIESGQIDVVHYFLSPYFIRYYEDTEVFFAGNDSGLIRSEDGLIWESVPFFDGRICSDFQSCYGHIIVTTQANLSHLFLSDDDGQTWTESYNQPGLISCVAFQTGCTAYGVFPDGSYSSGLWSSEDFGENWVNEFYSTNMNTVATASGESFAMVGWKDGTPPNEGIALCYTDNPVTEFIFLNETLPDKNINRIFYRLKVCCGATLYACTDSGVFSCEDYFVGIPEFSSHCISIEITPNPVTEESIITINNPTQWDLNPVCIMNSGGEIVDKIVISRGFTGKIKWKPCDLPTGVYYLLLRTNNEIMAKRFIIL
ncbi:MAG: T9SS type A sorting domain-containing protein [Bacteroidetes bacterium]|nr:T9SS type A sorting domain-containing protein [Bacteroidota bacterium]